MLAGPVLFCVGYVVHKALIAPRQRHARRRLEGEGHYAQLILTLGIALIMPERRA